MSIIHHAVKLPPDILMGVISKIQLFPTVPVSIFYPFSILKKMWHPFVPISFFGSLRCGAALQTSHNHVK